MSLIKAVLSNPQVPETIRQAALDRAHRSTGLPIGEGRTESFWLKEPHPTVARAQSGALPEKVDIAIIGSGITGLSVAWTILQTAKQHGRNPPSVVILEARDACSGATGRNGGHVLETVLEYLEFKQLFGKDAAMKLTRFRLGHMPEMEALMKDRPELRERSQLRKVEFVSVYFDEETFLAAVKSLEEFKKDMPEESQGFASHRGEKLQTHFHLAPHAIGAITGPAGAAWPYQLVTHLLAELQHAFPPSTFSLETNTPVTQISRSSSPKPHPYTLTTPRGPLSARHIVHTTNGYISTLVPGLAGRIFPVRGQMTAQGPGARFPFRPSLEEPRHSWLFNYANGGFDYLTQLPHSSSSSSSSTTAAPPLSDGELMLGGGLAATHHRGVDEVGVARDDAYGDVHVDIHLSGALEAVFGRENWGGQAAGVKAMWTGVMGFSADGFPWVGELLGGLTGREEKEEGEEVGVGGARGGGAEWAAAGYSGEGMVHAWLSGKAVGIMVLVREGVLAEGDGEEVRSWLPEQLWITEERVERAVLPRKVADL
ncbi:putative FAD dependent oxidoreductase [Lasiodiplodia theobromae]|uniref:putative FAD dependent oxidoreductase n=1 Tax=Lasiodiplodia theobromae TaxID=45133 RepID=UPI0015C30A23|nr:putative FAD dependent oxidoreductase [Lasiodiplodia theobromae]KAF4537470.1 putative FAD dependent oxidoreductase [Lasiodiplodia theobromae]